MIAVAAPGDDDARARPVEILLAMLQVASQQTRREVHRLLTADLYAPPTAGELRVAELGFLSSLIAGTVTAGSEFRTTERQEYDRLRPESAPTSRRLVEIYGSWSRACRAAYGLQADGTTMGQGKPWRTTNRGEPERQLFTREEAIAAVQLCASELRAAGIASAPTSWQYDEWVRRRKLQARGRGRKLRLPYAQAVYRLLPKRVRGCSRWKMVLKVAGLDASS